MPVPAPPPPPPPPPSAAPKAPLPKSNKQLLQSIENGTKLKKVPASEKNDRSSGLAAAGITMPPKNNTPTTSQSRNNGAFVAGKPVPNNGPIDFQSQLKSQLSAMKPGWGNTINQERKSSVPMDNYVSIRPESANQVIVPMNGTSDQHSSLVNRNPSSSSGNRMQGPSPSIQSDKLAQSTHSYASSNGTGSVSSGISAAKASIPMKFKSDNNRTQPSQIQLQPNNDTLPSTRNTHNVKVAPQPPNQFNSNNRAPPPPKPEQSAHNGAPLSPNQFQLTNNLLAPTQIELKPTNHKAPSSLNQFQPANNSGPSLRNQFQTANNLSAPIQIQLKPTNNRAPSPPNQFQPTNNRRPSPPNQSQTPNNRRAPSQIGLKSTNNIAPSPPNQFQPANNSGPSPPNQPFTTNVRRNRQLEQLRSANNRAPPPPNQLRSANNRAPPPPNQLRSANNRAPPPPNQLRSANNRAPPPPNQLRSADNRAPPPPPPANSKPALGNGYSMDRVTPVSAASSFSEPLPQSNRSSQSSSYIRPTSNTYLPMTSFVKDKELGPDYSTAPPEPQLPSQPYSSQPYDSYSTGSYRVTDRAPPPPPPGSRESKFLLNAFDRRFKFPHEMYFPLLRK